MTRVWRIVTASWFLACVGLSAQGPDIRANPDGVSPPEPVEVMSTSSETVACFFNGVPRLVRWNNAYLDDGTSTDVDATPVPIGSPGSQLLQGFGVMPFGTVVDGEIEGNDKLVIDCGRGFRNIRFTGFASPDGALVTLTNHIGGGGSTSYQLWYTGVPDPTLWFSPGDVGQYTRIVVQPLAGAFVVNGVSLP